MGFFFRKSFRLGPGRVSLSKSGPSFSAGIKGARIGVGARGAYLSAGWRGIFYRKSLSGSSTLKRTAQEPISTTAAVVIWLAVLAAGAIVVAAVGFVVWALS
jgi:hypothetical protein